MKQIAGSNFSTPWATYSSIFLNLIGTRAKSRSSNQNNANSHTFDPSSDHPCEESVKSCSETESDDWEQLEFAPPGSLAVPTPPPAITDNKIATTDLTTHHESRSDESSFYSARSELSICEGGAENVLNGEKQAEDIKTNAEKDLESLGACCSSSLSKSESDKEQLIMISTALGLNNIEGM